MSQVMEWTTDLKEICLRLVEPKEPTAAKEGTFLTWHDIEMLPIMADHAFDKAVN